MADFLYAIISVVLTISILITIKLIEYSKFKTLSGSHRMTGVVTIIILIAEGIYLAITLGLLSSAIEIVTSLSAILLFFTFVYLNKLQNAISGMSIALGTRIDVGKKIEFNGKEGTVIQVGLTKTIVQIDDSEKIILIPNKKFDEDAVIVSKTKDKQLKKR